MTNSANFKMFLGWRIQEICFTCTIHTFSDLVECYLGACSPFPDYGLIGTNKQVFMRYSLKDPDPWFLRQFYVTGRVFRFPTTKQCDTHSVWCGGTAALKDLFHPFGVIIDGNFVHTTGASCKRQWTVGNSQQGQDPNFWTEQMCKHVLEFIPTSHRVR